MNDVDVQIWTVDLGATAWSWLEDCDVLLLNERLNERGQLAAIADAMSMVL